MEPKFKWPYFGLIFVLALLGILIMQSTKNIGSVDYISIKKEIAKEVKAHPKLQIADLYKFIHQASMGSEHAVKDSNAAINWMNNELASMNKDYNNNLLDTLAPGGELVRVNLRPYVKLGYDTYKLTSAFVKTANTYKGSKKVLLNYWKYLLQMARDGEINFNLRDLENYIAAKSKQDFPAVHHSDIYEKLYFPAYRVVAGEYLKFLKK